MSEVKVWWQSRAIWTGLVAGLFAVLSIFKVVPEGLSQDFVVETILGALSLFTIYVRVAETKSITATSTPVE